MTSIPAVNISEPAVLIRIRRLFQPNMSADALYEATRGVWKIGNRRQKADLALAIADGIVREVYAIHSWHQAGNTRYRTRQRGEVEIMGRWEFVGEVAEAVFRRKYVDQSVAHYFKRGDQSPVRYVNC